MSISGSSNLFGKDKAIVSSCAAWPQADELLYVGDELRDIEACKKSVRENHRVAWGFDPLPLLGSGKPTPSRKTPEELLRSVRRL